jgi:hypothetical protein
MVIVLIFDIVIDIVIHILNYNISIIYLFQLFIHNINSKNNEICEILYNSIKFDLFIIS